LSTGRIDDREEAMVPEAEEVSTESGRPLRVLMLSWEYPPVLVGGLGRHVHALATSLAAAGHEVTVVTRHAGDAPLDEIREGVRVVRAPEDPPTFPLATPSLLAWTMAFNHALTRAALHATTTDSYDLIHAHDWLVTHTAVTVRDHLGIPLVATIHATEAGRHQGWLPEDMNKTIHTVEYWLGHEAARIITCSEYMRWEVSHLLDIPTDRITVIPNGVHAAGWQAPPRAVASARSRYTTGAPIIGFAGRLVYEKGVQDIVSALPALRDQHPGLRLVIAGDGPYRPELHHQVGRLRLQHAVHFAGHLGNDLPATLAATDTVVIPSIYEPFGMIALEAAAAGAPLAVAQTGGLAEIIQPGITGLTFPAGDPDALATSVHTLLSDHSTARRMAQRARAMVHADYHWTGIAQKTLATYRATISNMPENRARARAKYASIVVPDGNLLAVPGAAR
jgi:glycogen synthase